MTFSITAFSPLSGDQEEIWIDTAIIVDPMHPENVLRKISPTIFFNLPADICPQGGITLTFREAGDFTPTGLLSSHPYIKELVHTAEYLKTVDGKKRSQHEIDSYFLQNPHLPPPPMTLKQGGSNEQEATEESPLDNILSMVDIEQTDTSVSEPLTRELFYQNLAFEIITLIFKNKSFQILESAWLGLSFLCKNILKDSGIKLSIFPVTTENLVQSLEQQRAAMIADTPNLLIFDTPINNTAASMEKLSFLIDYADNLLTTALAWVESSFFRLEHWQEIDKLSFLPHTLDNPEFGQFRKIRSLPNASWLCLSCNRLIGRPVYKEYPLFNTRQFSESHSPWISPVWGIASLISKRIAKTGLPTGTANIRHNHLDLMFLESDNQTPAEYTEISFSEDRIEQLLRCGIVPLVSIPDQQILFITDTQMLAKDSTLSRQFLTSTMIHLILHLHDTKEYDSGTRNLTTHITEDLRKGLKEICQTNPGEIKITAETGPLIQGLPLHILWNPSHTISVSGESIAFHFLWE